MSNEEICTDGDFLSGNVKLEIKEEVYGFLKTEVNSEESSETPRDYLQENNDEEVINSSPKDSIANEAEKNDNSKKSRYKCDVCEKAFIRKLSLKEHEVVHQEIKPVYSCEYCDKKFISKIRMKSHSRTHNGEIFVCEVCNHKCMFKSRYDAHIRTHTREKPFKCNLCDMCFRVDSVRKRHESLHRKQKEPFTCPYCAETFPLKGNLFAHWKTHGNWPCTKCSRTFRLRSYLVKHIKTHRDSSEEEKE